MKNSLRFLLLLMFSVGALSLFAQGTDSTSTPATTPAPTPTTTTETPATPATTTEPATTTPAANTNEPATTAPAATSAEPAATAPAAEEPAGKKGKHTKTAKSGQAGESTGSAPATAPNDTAKMDEKKDRQNQLLFMKPDMDSKTYNFYQRKAISTPLMMRYDLDSAAYQRGKKKDKQQKAFVNRQYAFPAKPGDQWELSFNGGAAYLSGNVKPYTSGTGVLQNLGAGFNVRKALGYIFSLRIGYEYMVMTGRNWQPDANLKFDNALNGTLNPNVNYYSNPLLNASNTIAGVNMNKVMFYNYRAYMHEGHLDAVFNLGNISFHKERNFLNLYLFAGFSGIMFTTFTNVLNKNNQPYDFSKIYALYETNNSTDVNTRIKNQKNQSLKMLNGLYDGTYETQAERENDKPGYKNWEFEPTASAGLGFQFHISKWVTLGFEERIIFTQAHVDGYFWQQDEHSALVSHYDRVSYTSMSINIHLGKPKKTTEPMWWLNPVYHAYRKLGEVDPNSLMEQMFKDDDDDGVPNYLDKQPNTPRGCPVDAHGVALDSDHDGIIDCLDKEPYSPIGYPIDSNGVAIIPPNPCCDTSGNALNGNRNKNNNNNGDNNNEENGLGGVGKRRGNSGYDCSKIELPAVVFDEDKYYLDPQYYGNLHQIAERMQMCPDMKLVVTGYDESRNDQKFNEQLGWNRGNAAVDYLVEKYGVSRDRFIIKYQGGKKAATGTPFERKMKNKVEFRYANEGESGESNPPAPHPGLKAGSNK